MRRQIAVAATTVALAAGTAWISMGPASAATVSAKCNAAGAAKFDPGLTSTAAPQKVTLSGTLSGCTGKSGVKSGTFTGTLSSGQNALRCANFTTVGQTIATGTETLKYKGGTSSVVNVSIVITGSSQFSINGTVKSGRFKGHKVTGAMLVNTNNPFNPGANCGLFSPPVPVTTINFHGTDTVG